MTTATRNEAADRLRGLIGRWTSPATTRSLQSALDEALAAERRATVERLRDSLISKLEAAVKVSIPVDRASEVYYDQGRTFAYREAITLTEDVSAKEAAR